MQIKKGHSHCTGTEWTGVIRSQILEQTHKIWTTRFAILHDKVEEVLTLKESRHLCEEIKDKYTLGIVVIPPVDAHLTDQPPYMTLILSSLSKKNWIRSERIFRKEAAT